MRSSSFVAASLVVALLTVACGGTEPSSAVATSAGASSITPAAKPPPGACKGQTTSCYGVCVNLRNDVANCGACGNVCSYANGSAACVRGTCAFAGCDAGWADCDGSVANGCETDLQATVTSCGACGNACTVANGTPSCSAGMCGVASCNPGYYLSGGTCVLVGPPSATTSTLDANPQTVPNDGTVSSLTATILDAYGNPIPEKTVIFTSSGPATITQPAAPTDTKGKATGSISSSTVGVQTVTATVEGITVPPTTVTFVVPPPTAPPAIGAFYATPATIVAGGTATLAWSVTGAESLTIEGIGSATGSSVTVSPAATTTYTLTATNALGTATRSATVKVAPVLPSGLSGLDGVELMVEAGAQVTGDYVLSNTGAASHAATISVVNPHPELTVTVVPSSPMVFPPGQVTPIPIQVAASTSATGTYDDLLLSIALDDGSTVNASIRVTVLAVGTPNLPDLVVRADDIRLVGNDPGVSMTLEADVKNVGPMTASSIGVTFFLFGSPIGTDVVSLLPSQATATATITALIAVTNGDEYITVTVDPLNAIEEVDETNNEAAQVVRLGSLDTQPGILVIENLPTKVCTGASFSLTGHATYDLVVDGVPTTAYVVKGAAVQTRLRDPDGTSTTFGTTHTNIYGDFTQSLAVAMPGIYSLFTTVSDKTFSGTREVVFTAVDATDPMCVAPIIVDPPVIGGGGSGGGGGGGGGGPMVNSCLEDPLGCVTCSPDICPVPPGQGSFPSKNVWVWSDDIFFSNDRPAVNEEIFVYAKIRYWSDRLSAKALEVPVSVYVTRPGLPKERIAHTTIPSISMGSPDYGGRFVFANWRNPGEGVYIIEFAIDPSYAETYTLDNEATRAMIVGQYTGTLSAVDGHATGPWGGVANAIVTVYASDGITVIGTTVTDGSGFYLVENVPAGAVRVGIQPPAPYVPVVATQDLVLAQHALGTADFTLSTIAITPTSATVFTGGQAPFTASGGFGPYAWSISPNSSGGTITSSGQYTAGSTGGVTDTVVVTDAQGATARATVDVQANRWVQVAGGDNFSFGIKADGTLWGWGENSYGQLGIGSTISSLSPVLVGSGYASVSAGMFHALAVKTDGTLWAWGRNEDGQVGDGTVTPRTSPVLIGSGYAQVAAGGYHSLAVKSDGTLMAWGANWSGELGDGTTIGRWTPQPVGAGFASAAGGLDFTLAVKSDGTLVSFGLNGSGQLGIGSTVDQHTPQVVGTGYRAAAGGINGACGLGIDGTVFCWGGNGGGQVGDGTTTTRLLPVPVGTGFKALAKTVLHTVALKTDGSLWAWGQNAFGQLGDGTTTNARVPKQIMGGVAAAATGRGHTLAVKDDGTLLVWGLNSSGQFGDQTVLASLSPIPGGAPGASILHSPSLAFMDQPPSVQAGEVLPALRVQLLDGYGNVVATSTPTVQMSLRRATSLQGTTTVTPVNGEAVFADLYVTGVEESNLVATAPGYVTAYSRYFDVTPAAPSAATSTLTATPASVPADGTPTTLTTQVTDAYGNAVYDATVTFSSSGTATIVQPALVTDAYGITIGSISSTTIGAQQVTASVAGVPVAFTLVSFTCPADGTSCGSNLVCSSGACVSCVAGSECTPAAPLPCHTYAWSCSSGPACVDAGVLQAGTSCGDGFACDATGACVQSTRTVAGVFDTTYWIDDGTQVTSKVTLPSPPVAGTEVYALALGVGGYTRYDGSFDATTGVLTIPGVPGGSYLLVIYPPSGPVTFRQLETSSPDLTAQANGRPNVVSPTGTTNVLFDVAGLEPWQPGGDQLEMESSGASDWFFIKGDGSPGSDDLPAGVTSVSTSMDFNQLRIPYGFIGLPDASVGDVVFIHQLSQQVIPSGLPGAGTVYAAASRYARLTDVTVGDLTGGTIAATLQPVPTYRTVNLDVRLAEFAAFAPQLSPAAVPSGCTVFVDALPSARWGRSGSADLFMLELPLASSSIDLGAVAYGSFLDPIWKERANIRCYFETSVTVTGATTPAPVRSTFASEHLVDAVPPLAPALGPPLAPTINGMDAFQDQTGVGLTPTLSWNVPSLGAPESYSISVQPLRLVGTSTGLGRRFNVNLPAPPAGTTTMTFVIPPGILAAGREYVATISASQGTGYPTHSASTATAKFSP